jgi:hypothetical protein
MDNPWTIVFGSAHLPGCFQQCLFLLQSDATIALGLLLRLIVTPNRWNGVVARYGGS